jgi:hypothetical protein
MFSKNEAYRTWGFEYIYVLNPESRHLFRWVGTALEISDMLGLDSCEEDLAAAR